MTAVITVPSSLDDLTFEQVLDQLVTGEARESAAAGTPGVIAGAAGQLRDRVPLLRVGQLVQHQRARAVRARLAELADPFEPLPIVIGDTSLEPWIRQRLERRRPNMGKFVVNFVSQSLQQELLFFSLPFLIGATQRDLGQIGFTAIVAVAALVISAVAPISVMAAGVPVIFAVTGPAVPAMFIIAGVIYALFVVGYVAMSRHMVNAGGFVAYIDRAFGKVRELGNRLVFAEGYAQVAQYLADGEADMIIIPNGRVVPLVSPETVPDIRIWSSAVSPAGTVAGTVVEHASIATGQRGWNAHPGGTASGCGGSPPRPDGAMRNRASPIVG